jgi:predicted RNA binding protein YcfA (HicA-like mRNA interferase family)
MTSWPSTRAPRVLAALLRIGWSIKRQTGSHRFLTRANWPDFVFAFHDAEELGPRMLARIAKRTGLTPDDLCPALWKAAADRRPNRRGRRIVPCATLLKSPPGFSDRTRLTER